MLSQGVCSAGRDIYTWAKNAQECSLSVPTGCNPFCGSLAVHETCRVGVGSYLTGVVPGSYIKDVHSGLPENCETL